MTQYVVPTTKQLVAELRLWAGRGGDAGNAMAEEYLRVQYPVLNALVAADELTRMQQAIKAMHTGLTAGSCTCEDCQ